MSHIGATAVIILDAAKHGKLDNDINRELILAPAKHNHPWVSLTEEDTTLG